MRSALRGAAVAAAVSALVPMPAAAHGLSGRYDAPLPLAAYLAGAAVAVGLSFLFAFLSRGRWEPRPAERIRRLPTVAVLGLRALGVVALGWIVAQVIVGGSSIAEVGSLFTWVYGWVGLAILCAIVGPVWSWVDPFTTLHDAGASVLRRLGVSAPPRATIPSEIAAWPAVGLFVIIVWLELAYLQADMGLVVVGYTLLTLGGMAVFGRDPWREHVEVFSVWFGLLGRLALYAPAGPVGSPLVRRQRFPDGLLGSRWDRSHVALVAISVGAILYDGLSQTELFYGLFGLPAIGASTLLLGAFLAIVAALALGLVRGVGATAVGAGLLPISVGYLIAHYLTYLLGDGQRIVISISDPLQLGWDLFGTAFYEPSIDWLAPSILWTAMFVAVVGGHVLGAWAGHLGAVASADRDAHVRRDQVPLALVMVGLTTLTLWSLGQAVISNEVEGTATSSRAAMLDESALGR